MMQGLKETGLLDKTLHACDLAYGGNPELAKMVLEEIANEMIGSKKLTSKEKGFMLPIFKEASARVGVETSFVYAEHFYDENDKKAARGWLRWALCQASDAKIKIGKRVFALKMAYGDLMPLVYR